MSLLSHQHCEWQNGVTTDFDVEIVKCKLVVEEIFTYLHLYGSACNMWIKEIVCLTRDDLKVTVDVVEFVRPNGQKVFHKITLPGNLYAKVQRIAIVMGTTGGYQYTLEHLENGTAAVSLRNNSMETSISSSLFPFRKWAERTGGELQRGRIPMLGRRF